ncbi:MAG: thermonuclease family protein [Spirochaetaceae bacterium]|nr:thermonuclease family protein [Spirochaetaceae bacterium]
MNKKMQKAALPLVLFCVLQGLLPAASGGTAVYVTNSGRRYHRETCSSLVRSKTAISLSDAVRSGYRPCFLCSPPHLDAGFPQQAAAAELYRVNKAGRNGAALASWHDADLTRMLEAEVIRHVDGDTVGVRIKNPPGGIKAVETIRMIGVDTPETVHPRREVEHFGREASDWTKQALLHKQVFLAFDWELRDKYNRLLAYIYLPDGTLHNADLVRGGYGHAYTRFPFQFMEEFRSLEKDACEQKRGLWGD